MQDQGHTQHIVCLKGLLSFPVCTGLQHPTITITSSNSSSSSSSRYHQQISTTVFNAEQLAHQSDWVSL